MRGMPCAGGAQEGKAGALQLQEQLLLLSAGKSSGGGGGGGGGFWEPTSVLDHRHSPSPSTPTSASTLSSPLSAAADVAALAGAKNPPQPSWAAGAGEAEAAAAGKEEWAHQLPPLDMGLATAGEGWDGGGMLSEAAPPALGHDNSFLRWIIGDGSEDGSAGVGMAEPPVLELDHFTSMMPQPPLGPTLSFAAMEDTKAAPFGPPGLLLHHHNQQHAAFFGAFPSFDAQPPPRHHSMAGTATSAQIAPKLPPFASPAMAGGFLQQLPPPSRGVLKPKPEAAAGDEAAVVDQLAEAAKLAEARDAFGAREILARLNYRLPTAPVAGTPLLRSAFYFKQALHLALSTTGDTSMPPHVPETTMPFDVVLKLEAYKAFSVVSPVLQFAHFTCIQAVLDELGGAGCIHVLDFDIGIGAQWASLMQELAQHRPGAPATVLKLTAFVTSASHHPLELQLIHENLSAFASELGIRFQFTVFNLDTCDPTELLRIAGGEAVAVNLPVGSAHALAMPAILRLVKRLGAQVVVSIDHGGDRCDLPFAAHFFQAFQSCVFLLESVDAVGTDSDVASKIERFWIQPRIENCVLGRHRAAAAADKVLPWRTMFTSAGFVPLQISNSAEAQAELLLKKVQGRGFHVGRHAGSLFLYWQRGELVSVSAWRC